MKDRVIRERIFFFILVGILILLTLILIWPFLSAILAAVAFVVILKPLYSWLLEKGWVKGSENRAVAATIIIFILVIALPAVLIVGAAISQADALLSGEDLGGVERSLESAAAQRRSRNRSRASPAKYFRSTRPRSRRPFKTRSRQAPAGSVIC